MVYREVALPKKRRRKNKGKRWGKKEKRKKFKQFAATKREKEGGKK